MVKIILTILFNSISSSIESPYSIVLGSAQDVDCTHKEYEKFC